METLPGTVKHYFNEFEDATVPPLSLGTRERTLWKKAFFSAFPKIQFSSDYDEFFFAVAIMGSMKLIFSIKGSVNFNSSPKFGNAP
jgi:hypothetical protein